MSSLLLRGSAARFLTWVTVLAFLVRLAMVLALRQPVETPSGPGTSDDFEFHSYALSLVDGNGYRAANGYRSFRAPGFPFLLAGLYATVGMSPWIVLVAQCVLGALACVATYLLGRALLLGERQARAAALLGCFYLGHIYFSTRYFSEPLYILAAAGAVGCALAAMHTRSMGWAAAAGVTLGYAILTRPFALLAAPLVAIVVLAPRRGAARRLDPRALVQVTVMTVACLAVVLPWTVRNHRVHGQWVLVTTNGGSTFYGANNDRVVGVRREWGSWVSTVELPKRDSIAQAKNEVESDRLEWRFGYQWLVEHPGVILKLVAFKLGRMWWLPEFDAGGWQRALRVVGHVPYVALILLGLLEVVRRPRLRSREWWTVHAMLAATLLTVLIFWGSSRFRDANHPFLMLYAAVGLARLLRWPTDAGPVAAPARGSA